MLGRGDGVVHAKGQSGRAVENGLELAEADFFGGEPGQGILDDGILNTGLSQLGAQDRKSVV